MSRERELLERAYQYIPLSSITSQEIRTFLADTDPSETINSQEVDRSEPVAWFSQTSRTFSTVETSHHTAPLFLHPAQRPEFVRLSEEEMRDILWRVDWIIDLPKAVMDALEEKNK